MKSNSADILFMPVCSNCGRVINCDVTYRDSLYHEPHINPRSCPYCNCIFESIQLTVPSKNGFTYYLDEEVSVR